MRGSPVGYVNDFTGVQTSVCRETTSIQRGDCVLMAEIETLLNKREIRVVPEVERRQGFYSQYFVIPKKGGTTRHPILDLLVLNKHLIIDITFIKV